MIRTTKIDKTITNKTITKEIPSNNKPNSNSKTKNQPHSHKHPKTLMISKRTTICHLPKRKEENDNCKTSNNNKKRFTIISKIILWINKIGSNAMLRRILDKECYLKSIL